MINFIISIVIGAIAGWLASQIMKTKGGLLRNIILGIIGGFVGGYIFGLLGISSNGFLGNILVSMIGACILIYLAKWLFK